MTTADHFVVAVLVPASTTIDTIDVALTPPMRFLMPGVVDRYRLGGQFTGAWDPDYDPRLDPANWRPCPACTATSVPAGHRCTVCADAETDGRRTATVLAGHDDWRAHAGDIIALTRLLDPDWRFPTRQPGAAAAPSATPALFADRHGVVWLDATSTGQTPARLTAVWRSLLDGNRQPAPGGEPFDPTAWSIALVAAHQTPDHIRATLPVVGSVVQITDPDWAEDDVDNDQLYVVGEDVDAPYYQLVRIGGYGPTVPGYAVTEIDPARVTLTPASPDAPLYRDSLSRRHASSDEDATGAPDGIGE